MFVLRDEIGNVHDMDFDAIHEKLRANGCHSPTEESLYKLFRVIKQLSVVSRLQNDRIDDKIIMSGEAILRQLKGEDTRLDLTGNGFEFTGWYTELLLFTFAGLIEGHGRLGFSVTHRFIRDFCRANEDYVIIQERFLEHVQQNEYVNRLRTEIINRVKRFELVNLLLAGSYASR